MTAVVADLGIGNLRSLVRALERTGVEADIGGPDRLVDADLVVLPGVGAFGPAAERLDPIRDDLLEAIEAGRPCLGICLGLQVLFEASEESDRRGLGFFEGRVRRFEGDVKVPHMGWSPVTFEAQDLQVSPPWFYFAHSYHPVPEEDDVVAASCTYGGTFACAVRKANTVGFQFHPEKSGEAGLELLGRALDTIGVDR